MFCYFHLSFNIKTDAWALIHTLHLWTVNPAYFNLIGHLNHFDIDK